ncbi:hypothetical protein OH77DRAFT_152546 [Trametes cingulata]|nr:hypothetical protein OH77DRAFT_152546 [Trametes cingulata]
MNSTGDASISVFLAEDAAFVIEGYFSAAAAVLVVWHHLLTLNKEVSLFWRRKRSGACVLFFANRYLAAVIVLYAWCTPSTHYSLCCWHLLRGVPPALASPALGRSPSRTRPSARTPSGDVFGSSSCQRAWKECKLGFLAEALALLVTCAATATATRGSSSRGCFCGMGRFTSCASTHSELTPREPVMVEA